MKRLLRGSILAALWFGLWLLLVEKFDKGELLVGAACALLAAFASEVAWGTHLNHFTANVRALAQMWRVPWAIVRGTCTVFAILLRHLFTRRKAGSFMHVVAFDVGEPDHPRDAMRRALAIAYTSMSPPTVIIGIDLDKERLLYHELEPAPVPPLLLRLGAKA